MDLESRAVPSRNLPTTRLSLLAGDHQIAVTCYYDCLRHDSRLGGGDTKEGALVMVILNGGALAIPERFWTHRCCRCARTGAVIPQGGVGSSVLIDWKCRGCGRLVCFNCTLTVPGSVPLRFREDTLCSEECWRKIGAPREEEEQTADGGRPEALEPKSYRCGSCQDTGRWSTGIECPVCAPPAERSEA